MSEKRFERWNDYSCKVKDNQEETLLDWEDVVQKLNEQDKEIGLLRLELETQKHPLWSTREAEKKVNKLSDSLADEVKKNGLLNEELNQLRIENERLKEENEQLKKQIQIYKQLISNSYVGEEETLDGFVGKYVIWENELQKYKVIK